MLTPTQERHSVIRQFMEDTFLFAFGTDAGEEDNLFELGLVDSYGFVEMITFLEDKYGIKFTEEDMTSPRMMSSAGIFAIVDEKLETAAG
jgi:acyl carrier protein